MEALRQTLQNDYANTDEAATLSRQKQVDQTILKSILFKRQAAIRMNLTKPQNKIQISCYLRATKTGCSAVKVTNQAIKRSAALLSEIYPKDGFIL
jgi:hypothetical protein